MAEISIARASPKISHLFFADDSLVFLKAATVDFGLFKSILQDYEKESGQSVNLGKSSVFFSPNVPGDRKRYLCNMLSMKVSGSLRFYLGLPSSFHKGKS